jgi:hypothetical protein
MKKFPLKNSVAEPSHERRISLFMLNAGGMPTIFRKGLSEEDAVSGFFSDGFDKETEDRIRLTLTCYEIFDLAHLMNYLPTEFKVDTETSF